MLERGGPGGGQGKTLARSREWGRRRESRGREGKGKERKTEREIERERTSEGERHSLQESRKVASSLVVHTLSFLFCSGAFRFLRLFLGPSPRVVCAHARGSFSLLRDHSFPTDVFFFLLLLLDLSFSTVPTSVGSRLLRRFAAPRWSLATRARPRVHSQRDFLETFLETSHWQTHPRARGGSRKRRGGGKVGTKENVGETRKGEKRGERVGDTERRRG